VWRTGKHASGGTRALIRLIVAVLLLVGTALGAYYYGLSRSPAGLGGADRESLSLYAEALDIVRDDYVDQEAIDPRKQTYGAIEGMLDSLGDEGHTRFLTPEEAKSNREGLSGTYVGIGVQLEEKRDNIVVAAPIEGSPADEAGVKTGDVIVAVDDDNVRGEELSEIVDKVKGPEGSTVKLTVSRGGDEREFDLERSEITSPAVSWARLPGTDVALIQLSTFSDTSAEEFDATLEEAQKNGAKRFILDLRDNPGGRLQQAVEVAGQFLESGSVVYIREDASGEREKVRVEDDGEYLKEPLVVLVNGGSASSSEILAGALRDNGRATVVGVKTFGTGTVLSEFTLRDGSVVLLGVAEWLTPDGNFIRETGIEPDVRVEFEGDSEPVSPVDVKDLSLRQILERDNQLRAAFEELQKG
jgi:carboxyl-terminal processing protease